MRHTVHLLVDELPGALERTAALLGAMPFRIEHLTIATGHGGQARLSAVVDAPAGMPVTDLFTRAVAAGPRVGGPVPSAESRLPSTPQRVPSASLPYHWQADGAGDDRVG